MERKTVIVLVVLFLIGAGIYSALLWYPFGGWLFEHVVTPLAMRFGLNRRNPNFLEGMGIMFACLVLQVIVFLLPYLLLWGIIIACLLRLKQ